MRDEALVGIDEALARAAERPARARAAQARQSPSGRPPAETHEEEEQQGRVAHLLDHPIWPQLFFAIQFLWGIPLFLPNAQAVRFIVRALPYVSSLAFLVLYMSRSAKGAPRGTAPLIAALFLLVLNLANPSSQPAAGLAQCIFQLSIAAPMFWMYRAVRSPKRLESLIGLILVMNFLSAGVGVLQVYYPRQFMPPQISSQLDQDLVDSMTYVGSDGRVIMRPPGLSDTPGGAAIAGGITVVLGLGVCLYTRKLWQTALATSMGAVGLAAVYLTQVRSVFLMALGALAVTLIIAIRQGRIARAGWGLAAGGTIIVASFLWAASVGGSAVADRFLSLRDQGAISTYQENRGGFLSYTVGEMLDKYPLGAGVGRWGMMQSYFGDGRASTPIYVEIQLTGWLLDGGIPMWIFYGLAILLAMVSAFEASTGGLARIRDVAPMMLSIEVFILGMSLSGPAFNMQLGILFWACAGALAGAASGARLEVEGGARP